MTHPNDEDLLSACLEGGPTDELRALAAGPDGGELAARLRAAEALASLVGDLALEPPPRSVAKAARALGRAPRPGLRLLLAQLWSPPAELRPAYRGATATPRTYRAEPYELDVTLASGGALVGELVAADDATPQPTSGRCTLFGDAVRTTELEADGGFHLAGVEPGSYRLVIDLDDADDVICCELDLG